jgi:hypothetical protein
MAVSLPAVLQHRSLLSCWPPLHGKAVLINLPSTLMCFVQAEPSVP